MLYSALDPGTDDDRMKGALWTLNTSAFGEPESILVYRLITHRTSLAKYAVGGKFLLVFILPSRFLSSNLADPTLAPEFLKRLFACQHREKVQ